MRNIIQIILVLVCGKLIGQTQANKDLNGQIFDVNHFNNISSDWRNTTTNKINKFDWTNQSLNNRTFSTFDNPVILNGTNYYGADPVELPFYRTSTPNVNNPNLLPYDINPFIPSNLDIHPEDGWEMLQMDFGGRLVAENKVAKGNEINDYPHLVIYNRYTSKIRIYFLVPHKENFNGSYISVSFPPTPKQVSLALSARTAVFSHAKPITNHLSEWDNATYLTATNEYTPNARILQWVYGEFDLAYDPCTCLLKNTNLTAKIFFQLHTINLKKIDLVGESSTIHNVANPSVTGAQNINAGKTSFMDDISGAIGTGQQFYKDWSGYANSANSILDNGYNLWSKKLEKDFFKHYSGGINDPKTGLPITDLAGMKASGIWNEWLKIEKTNDPKLNLIKDLKNVASIVPYVGTAIGVVDYLVNGGKKDEQTIAAPSISNTQYKFTGSLTYNATKNVGLNLPGAKTQTFTTINSSNNEEGRLENGKYLVSTENPVYNEPLGVFNLLGAPKFESIDYTKTTRMADLNDVGVGFNYLSDQSHKPIDWFAIQQCRITEIPKYVVNPAADVEVISIDAAIVLEFESNVDGYNLFMDKYSEWSKFATLPFHKDYWKNPSAISLEDRIKSIEESGLELEYVSDGYPSVAKKAVIRFRTAYVPYSCLTMPNFSIFNWNKGMKVYLKLMVRLQRKHKGSSASFVGYTSENEKIPINMVFSYDVTKAYNERTDNTWSEKGSLVINQTPASIVLFDGITQLTQEEYTQTTATGLFLGDWRAHIINISKVAYPNPFIPGGNQTFVSNTTNLLTSENITIPSGSSVPANAIIKAGENVIIEDNVTFGDNVQVIAGKDIIVNHLNTINPNVELKIENGIWLNGGCQNSNISSLRANDDEILSLCNSNRYKQNAGLSKTDFQDELPINIESEKKGFDLSISPNPASNAAQLVFNVPYPTIINVDVFDISGNKVQNIINNSFSEYGNHIELINTQKLSSGIYFVTLSTTSGYIETQKLVIVK